MPLRYNKEKGSYEWVRDSDKNRIQLSKGSGSKPATHQQDEGLRRTKTPPYASSPMKAGARDESKAVDRLSRKMGTTKIPSKKSGTLRKRNYIG